MTDHYINGGNRRTLAVELLGAALALDLDPSVVRTTSKGFRVPAEVAEAAGYGGPDDVDTPTPAPDDNAPPVTADDGSTVEDEGSAVERPKDTDNKDSWVDYAKALGATDEDLAGEDGKVITKAAIIAAYGNKE